ncbi:MAG: uroporphyrinogen decarboxylase family protein [Anaerolineae bacterium]
MKPKEVMFQAFERKHLEHVPATVFGGGVWTIRHHQTQFGEAIADPKAYAELIIKTNEELNSPIVYVGSGYNNYLAAALGGKIKERPLGAPDLAEEIIQEHADELDAIDLAVIEQDPVIQNIWEATRLVVEAIGDDYVVTTTSWGPFTLAGQMFGVEDFMRATFKRKDEAHKTLQFATDLLKRFYRPLVEEGIISMMSIADPTGSGDLISARHFRTYCLPYLQPLIAWGHEHNCYTWLHICGDTTDKLTDIAETGADCFSLDYKVDLAKARAIVGDRMCLAGNINPVDVLDQGLPENVRQAGQACIAAVEGGTDGFILTGGCDVPPTVPLENLQAMLDLGR